MHAYETLLTADVSVVTYIDVNSTFDPEKSAANLVKHGVDLAFGDQIFGDADAIVLSSIRAIDGEERFKAIGLVEGRLFTAVHVVRDGVVRFISVRRSNDGEERFYHRT